MLDQKQIDKRFDHHPPDAERVRSHEYVRAQTKSLAAEFNRIVPEGWELALALTKLEEALFWANAAIARDTEE